LLNQLPKADNLTILALLNAGGSKIKVYQVHSILLVCFRVAIHYAFEMTHIVQL